MNEPPDYNSDQLFKSNTTFCVVCVFNLQFEKSVFLRRVVHSQSILQRQLRREILKNTFTSLLITQTSPSHFEFLLKYCLHYANFIDAIYRCYDPEVVLLFYT
jgi:hypothetical protein